MKTAPLAFGTDAQKIIDDEAIRYCRDHYRNAHLGHVNRMVEMAEELRDLKSRMKIGEVNIHGKAKHSRVALQVECALGVGQYLREVGAIVYDAPSYEGEDYLRARLCYVMPNATS